ncbi:WS/DGAT domain-containing protein [Mycobacterium lepromatosis]|uniref:WS/DGAT domain-containing protein n=1 Tax=Mycobacterium lepromatosis TaxID=480418 RepID=UPI000AB1C9EC|nr:WS/DGAT domain-containing protein [Mycobacterium lepromatosis]
MLSYGDELVFGITTDYDTAPDSKQLTAGIELEITQLAALSHDSILLLTKDRYAR